MTYSIGNRVSIPPKEYNEEPKETWVELFDEFFEEGMDFKNIIDFIQHGNTNDVTGRSIHKSTTYLFSVLFVYGCNLYVMPISIFKFYSFVQ